MLVIMTIIFLRRVVQATTMLAAFTIRITIVTVILFLFSTIVRDHILCSKKNRSFVVIVVVAITTAVVVVIAAVVVANNLGCLQVDGDFEANKALQKTM